jgi:hypothetical protein
MAYKLWNLEQFSATTLCLPAHLRPSMQLEGESNCASAYNVLWNGQAPAHYGGQRQVHSMTLRSGMPDSTIFTKSCSTGILVTISGVLSSQNIMSYNVVKKMTQSATH